MAKKKIGILLKRGWSQNWSVLCLKGNNGQIFIGPVSHLWKIEGREFLWTQRRGKAGGPHQGSFFCCRKSHWKRWKDGNERTDSANPPGKSTNPETFSEDKLLFVTGQWAAELDMCRSGGAQGPDAWRERPGHRKDQWALLCMSGVSLNQSLQTGSSYFE